MYVRRLDPSVLVFSLSLHRHPFLCILFNSRFTSYNKFKVFQSPEQPRVVLLCKQSSNGFVVFKVRDLDYQCEIVQGRSLVWKDGVCTWELSQQDPTVGVNKLIESSTEV
jgi:hypothetical protein